MRKGYSLFDNYIDILKKLGIYGNVMLISLGVTLYQDLLGKLDGVLILCSVNKRLIDIGRELWQNVEVVLIRKLNAVYYDALRQIAGIAEIVVLPACVDKDRRADIVYRYVLEDNLALPGASVVTSEVNELLAAV